MDFRYTKQLIALALSSSLLIISKTGLADTIVDTGVILPTCSFTSFGCLGPQPAINNSSLGWSSLAAEFTINAAYTINSIQIFAQSGNALPLTISIDSNNNRNIFNLDLPGTELYRATSAPLTADFSFQGISGLSWNLDFGTYWVVFSTPYSSSASGADFISLLSAAKTPLAGYAASNSSTLSGAWFPNNVNNMNLAMIINATPTTVPIPAPIWLFGSAFAGFIGFNLRRKSV